MTKNYIRNVVSRLIGQRYLFYTIVFGLFAFFLFQYWQTISQPPTLGYNEASIGGVPVQLWTPDRLFVGNENQQEFELVVNDLRIPEYSQVTVIVDSPDENAGFSRDNFTFIPGSSHDETNKAAVFYSASSSPADSFVVQATIKFGNEQGLLSRTILVESYSKSILVFLSAVFAGLLALLNLVYLIGSRSKKN